MKFSLNWLNRYTSLPMGNIEELNKIIDRIALQVVDVDERWVSDTDAIIDIDNKIVTNRPYAFGHRGLAREIAVMLSQGWSGDVFPSNLQSSIYNLQSSRLPVQVTVEAPELCPRFTAVAVKGVKVGPSPEFLKYAVESVGLRSINNLVDITNMIMLDTAQPVHAYDYDKIKDGHLIIRRATDGEKVTTLDGVERSLTTDILLITDAEKPVGIGGVMGAGNSEIDENTTNVLLEVAHFQPMNIRQTAKLLKHRTDAVTRFEKGVDPTNIPNVMEFLAELVVHVCGGEIASEYIDVNNLEKSTVRTQPLTMDFDPNRVNKLLGFGVKEEETKRILDGFGIKITSTNESGTWMLEIPSYRPDIKEPADIIEDIGRMFGYQNIPSITPVNKLVIPPRNPKVIALKKIRKALNAAGLDEVITYPFIAEKDLRTIFNLQSTIFNKEMIPLVNPLSSEYKYLRTTLVASMAKVTGLNARHFDTFGVFEIAKKFIRKPGEVLPYEKDHGASMQPDEIEVVSMMYYSKEEKEKGIFHLKAALENVTQELGINKKQVVFGVDGEVLLNNREIGRIGLLTDKQLKVYELDYPASYLEVELKPLLDQFKDTRSVKPFSKFQGTTVDYSVLVPLTASVSSVEAAIPSHACLVSKEVVDVYKGLKDVDGKKSITIRVYLQKNDATVTAGEVYEIAQIIEAKLKSVEGLEIRGGGVQKPANYQPSSQKSDNKAVANTTLNAELLKAENNKIVVAKILEIKQHPNADKLVITKVAVGAAKPENTLFADYIQIVTGAKNIHEGDLVPVALPGAVIPGMLDENGKNVVIKKGNLRGERSEGMMCSARELGHSDDHSGILILDPVLFESKVGQTYLY
jgi:phenylalanyl-tRNA synthetase beta chain